jgi:hypothetical protein
MERCNSHHHPTHRTSRPELSGIDMELITRPISGEPLRERPASWPRAQLIHHGQSEAVPSQPGFAACPRPRLSSRVRLAGTPPPEGLPRDVLFPSAREGKVAAKEAEEAPNIFM